MGQKRKAAEGKDGKTQKKRRRRADSDDEYGGSSDEDSFYDRTGELGWGSSDASVGGAAVRTPSTAGQGLAGGAGVSAGGAAMWAAPSTTEHVLGCEHSLSNSFSLCFWGDLWSVVPPGLRVPVPPPCMSLAPANPPMSWGSLRGSAAPAVQGCRQHYCAGLFDAVARPCMAHLLLHAAGRPGGALAAGGAGKRGRGAGGGAAQEVEDAASLYGKREALLEERKRVEDMLRQEEVEAAAAGKQPGTVANGAGQAGAEGGGAAGGGAAAAAAERGPAAAAAAAAGEEEDALDAFMTGVEVQLESDKVGLGRCVGWVGASAPSTTA